MTFFRHLRRGVGFALAGLVPFGMAYLTARYLVQGDWIVVLAEFLGLYALYSIALRWAFPRIRMPGAVQAASDTLPVNERGHRTDWLLLLRGIAAGLVFIMHSGIVFKHDFHWGGASWAWFLYSPAWLGMVLFFTLSGYLMGKGFYSGKYSLDRPGVARYLQNRFLRIIPLTLVVAGAIVVLQAPIWLGQPALGVRISLFGFNGIAAPEGLEAFWSLSTEWQFYLIVPVVALVFLALLRRRALVPLGVGLIVIGGIGIRWVLWVRHDAFVGWDPFVYTPLYGNIDVFLLGFIANWIRPTLHSFDWVLRRIWVPTLFVIYLGYSYVAYRAITMDQANLALPFGVILPALTSLLVVVVIVGMEASNDQARIGPNTARRRKVAWVLYWVGALTFPVYLVHSPIFIAIQTGVPQYPYLVRLLLGILITFAVAMVLHLTVERTVLGWRVRLGQRRQAPEPQESTATATVP